jgi:hypoxanthine phosphoribosyltransferase
MSTIQLHDKTFKPYLGHAEIQASIAVLAERINLEYKDKNPLFLGILNGSFMFAADLMKKLSIDCEISFVKLSSYSGTSTTGNVKNLIGLTEEVRNRHIIIVEDIVDTGITLQAANEFLTPLMPASIRTATLLFKPDAYKGKLPIDYVAFRIPNDFVVGYGLDYDGLGRNLPDIYCIVD